MMQIHPSGYYAWLKQPKSARQTEDDRLLGLIKQFWLESGCVYGYRKIHKDLRELGETSGKNRVARLMKQEGLKAQVGYKKPRYKGSRVAILAENHLKQDFAAQEPNKVWVTDITYIRLSQGFIYLVAVIDWFSRYVLSWQVSNTMDVGFCLEALEQALHRGQPLVFNTDQGAQFTSAAFTGRLERQGIQISQDGRGRALDNIFVERLWRSVKYEEVYLKSYTSVLDAVTNLNAYFSFYNHKRLHQSLNYRTPAHVHFG